MASEVEIANNAAARIGLTGRITSLLDNRTIARTFKEVWAQVRQATLRSGSYNFSTFTTDLAAEGDDVLVPYPWEHAFELPGESLRLIEVLNLSSRRDYELQGRMVLCDSAGPLHVRCVRDVPEMALWDAAAADAFSLLLACRTGRKLAGSAFDLEACKAEFRQAIGTARHVDATENPPIPMEDGGWIEARITGNWMAN